MTPAEICRANGWQAGAILREQKGLVVQILAIDGPMVICRIAITHFLVWAAVSLRVDFKTLWTKLDTHPLDDTPPKEEWFE